ncbi:MAG: hypothetical protein AAGN35_14965 [Bacteroidota bacterium]
MSNKILKFINYTKEAFLWPVHLVFLGFLTLTTIAGLFALPEFLGLNPTGLLFIAGGIEMLSLSAIVNSRRFRRAINAKYSRELQGFAYLKQLTDMYNALSAGNQRRFESFRNQLNEVKKNYANLNSSVPDLVMQYIEKIDHLQLNYIRLLTVQDRFPEMMQQSDSEAIRQQIRTIRAGMGNDSPKLREVKQKRIALLEKRLRNYTEASENGKVIDQQLKTIEEMIQFFAEQPINDRTRDEVGIIDNLLSETDELHTTLGEVDDIMRTEIINPMEDTSSGNVYSGFDSTTTG